MAKNRPQAISTKELEAKIESIKRKKLTKRKVVNLDDYRRATRPSLMTTKQHNRLSEEFLKKRDLRFSTPVMEQSLFEY
ncbi:MAG: hypothetical protein HYS98_06850 [Deltaproteobacteria bacterium]|nr:hypothetical protein [Deltaproteobacteria bacterium]